MNSSDMNTSANDLEIQHDREEIMIPPSIVGKTDIPIVAILTPALNDSCLADYWQHSFDKIAFKFRVLGAHAISVPWSNAPLVFKSDSPSICYVANLVWGYHTMPDRWEAWLHSWPKDVLLINSPSLLLWNTRKTYLKDLEKAGIEVVPTLYVEEIDERTLVNAATYFTTSDLILKPQISASSFNTLRVLVDSSNFASSPKALSVTAAVDNWIRSGANQSAAIIQPFMTNVIRDGEYSVLMFNGQVSHTIRKNASSDDYRVQHEYGGMVTAVDQAPTEMLDLAYASVAACPEIPIYARVDIIRNHLTGRWCIMELELIEPGLFLNYATDEGMAFAVTILQVHSQNMKANS